LTDWKFLLFAGAAVACLAYCLWKTQADWQQKGFGFAVVWGFVASLAAFLFVGFLFLAQVMADL